jgi:DNA-binding transcriptional ArsR family regulator
MQLRKVTLPEYEIHRVLSNPRRREALRELGSRPGTLSVRELADSIAEAESGLEPAPSNVRDSVYISLHQTHLPKLHELGIVNYDRETRSVELLEGARFVDRYMDVVTAGGFTWGEYYRGVGVVGLLATTAALAELPLVSAVDPLLWASGFLAVFAVSTAYQLWTNRWNVLRGLFD